MTFRALLSALTVARDMGGMVSTGESLLAQTDTRWQWCIVTDPDAAGEFVRELTAWVCGEPRIAVIDGRRLGAMDPREAVIQMASGDYLCWLESGDRLEAGLVGVLRGRLHGDSWLYTDEALKYRDEGGHEMWFKPDYSPELLRSQPYAVRSAVLPRAVVERVGGVDPQTGSAAWYDLVLRVSEVCPAPIHLAGPYYIRAPEVAPSRAPWVDGAAADRCTAVLRHCHRTGIPIDEVVPVEVAGRPIGQRLCRRLGTFPTVSVIIPTRGHWAMVHGLPECLVVGAIRSIWTDGRYPELELVVVYDDETPVEVLDELSAITDGAVVLLPFHGEFHFSRKCNAGALAASGDLLLFLNDDTRVVTPDWLHEMVSLLQDPTVGAVGARLLFADGTLQHAGHLYHGGVPDHLLFAHPQDSTSAGGAAQLTSERSGVTGACMLMRTADFTDVGGFSELFALNYNDVDLCLKLRADGRRILFTPFATLYHYESQTREFEMSRHEAMLIRRRWLRELVNDPYLNELLREPAPQD